MVIAGVLRVVVHGIALYLLASTVAACVLELVPSRAAHRLPLLDRLTAAPVRRVVHAAFGVGLSVSALTSMAPKSTGTATAPEPTTVETTIPSPPTPAVAAPPMPVAAQPPAPETVTTWTVRPGDHFWSIAEHLLSEGFGRPVTDSEVDPYWRRLVETNRDRLADPHNEDLLFEGQQLAVPPLPAPPEIRAN